MTSLAKIIEQIKSEITVSVEGKGRASIRATARLAGVNEKALRYCFDGAELQPSKLAQTLINQGFDVRNWNEMGIPDLAIALICEYYAFDAGRYCNEQARLIYRAFASIGIRTWMQEISGYQPQTLPVDIRLNQFVSNLNALGIDISNPRYHQAIKDVATNQILGLQPQLPEANKERWAGVVEIAESLGYAKISRDITKRSLLGRYISKQAMASGLIRKQEERLCNGRACEIFLYLVTPQLEKMISDWCSAV